jgi:hypothetical protein
VPAEPDLASDPSYSPPERASVGSIHDSPDADSSSPAAGTNATSLTPWLVAAIAGGLVLIGIVAGLLRRSRSK